MKRKIIPFLAFAFCCLFGILSFNCNIFACEYNAQYQSFYCANPEEHDSDMSANASDMKMQNSDTSANAVDVKVQNSNVSANSTKSVADDADVLINLERARYITIKGKPTYDMMAHLVKNEHIENLIITDVSGLTNAQIIKLYPYLSKGDIAMAALLFSYESSWEAVGNDGTMQYRRVCSQEFPQIATLRSCATVVSGAICAAGAADYASEGTAGLVEYFEGSDDWVNMGALKSSEMKSGDIVFIDRKSHAKQYQSGEISDSEFEIEEEEEYNGGYDSTGHKNYETQDPTGSASEVFCPDQDGDGEVNDWEAEYWKCYWQRVYPEAKEIPSYDYYYQWKAEAEELAQKREQQKKAEKEEKKKTRKTKVIHDHIFVWTGNDVAGRRFPGTKGNIVSGSYTEKYSKARSAAVSKYNFTGDYRIYRYVGEYEEGTQ